MTKAARSLKDVVAASPAVAGTVRLDGRSRTLSVVAIEPSPLEYDRSLAALAVALRRGDAGVNATAAMLRGLKQGTILRMRSGAKKVSVRVGSVVRGDALFEHELVIPLARARLLGLRQIQAVIVAARPKAVAAVTRALVRAAGDAPVRIRSLQGYEEPGTVLPHSTIRRYFGSFPYVRGPADSIVPDPRWVNASIVWWRVPVIGWVQCHRNIIPQLAYALWEIQLAGLDKLIGSYDGCFVPRFQRGDPTTVSAHAWGIAIDINAATNAMGANPTLDRRIVAIMKRWGFAWGGDWKVPDGMHFEFVRYPPRSQFQQAASRARKGRRS